MGWGRDRREYNLRLVVAVGAGDAAVVHDCTQTTKRNVRAKDVKKMAGNILINLSWGESASVVLDRARLVQLQTIERDLPLPQGKANRGKMGPEWALWPQAGSCCGLG